MFTDKELEYRRANMIKTTLYDVSDELREAEKKYNPMHSLHEGAAVIREEYDELWDEIKKWPKHNPAKIKREAIQLAAMAVRLVEDLL